jgi:hypothetical protein
MSMTSPFAAHETEKRVSRSIPDVTGLMLVP